MAITYMIATTKKELAILMTAMIIGGVVGITAAPLAEATAVNTTRSNIKSQPIIQQEGDVSCTNQALGQGGQQAVANNDLTSTGDQVQGDPVPDIDVKMGRNPGGSGAGAGVSSEGDPTVDAEQSNACSMEQNITAEQNHETGDDLSTNEWAG